jgi:UPF0716 protein FxsA
MAIWLFLLFVVVPFVDLVLLLRIGSLVGFWPTIAFTIAMGMLGAWLAKREGLRVWRAWRQALAELRTPDEGIIDGVLVIAGGALLITPGLITDFAGFLLLIPFTRRLAARLVRRAVDRRIASGRLQVMSATTFTPFEGLDDEGVARPDDGGVVDTTGESVGEVPELPRRDD